MKYDEVINKFNEEYEKIKNRKDVSKPLTWALKKTYKWEEENEKIHEVEYELSLNQVLKDTFESVNRTEYHELNDHAMSLDGRSIDDIINNYTMIKHKGDKELIEALLKLQTMYVNGTAKMNDFRFLIELLNDKYVEPDKRLLNEKI